jgi:metallo-beta-lactamase class B
MSKARIAGLILTAWMMAAAATAQTPTPYPSSGPADWAAVKAHADKAYTVAGAQWRATADYFCQPGARANKITDAPVHPAKIFDNVYVLGDVGTVVYAVTTPDGIVLIDSSYPTNTEKLLLPQMAQLGLDPAKVTHVLITHGHADHYGGAGYFQSKSGAKVVLSPADWDMVAAAKPGPGTPPPRRDVEIQDLKPVMAGGLAFTPVLVPGHTPERLTVDTLTQELASWEKFATTAKAMKVDVELQNHPLFDNMPAKLDAAAARQPGQPNPFVVGASSYARFTGTIIECLKADIARKGGKA